mmetsp:Transcript_67361/g.78151  ORF Transcript_67361/g.78151 Transcript_67361/m.78151 type:complete len:224 (-) Transcript_67361:191-862(-)
MMKKIISLALFGFVAVSAQGGRRFFKRQDVAPQVMVNYATPETLAAANPTAQPLIAANPNFMANYATPQTLATATPTAQALPAISYPQMGSLGNGFALPQNFGNLPAWGGIPAWGSIPAWGGLPPNGNGGFVGPNIGSLPTGWGVGNGALGANFPTFNFNGLGSVPPTYTTLPATNINPGGPMIPAGNTATDPTTAGLMLPVDSARIDPSSGITLDPSIAMLA